MKYKVVFTSKYIKEVQKMSKRGKDLSKLYYVANKLENDEMLDRKFKDHKLANTENYKNYRECHIEPDWILVYKKEKERLILTLIETGSHSDLF